MENLMNFRDWAERWYRENGRTEEKITKSDIDFLGLRLRKAIYAVFGFGDCEEVTDMYDDVEINDIYPDIAMPIDQESKHYNRSVVLAVGSLPEEEWTEYFANKVRRLEELDRQRTGTAEHLQKLEKAALNDKIASDARAKAENALKMMEEKIESSCKKFEKNPLGKKPFLEEIGKTESELYNFLMDKFGRGGKMTPYSLADIQKGYWEKVDVKDREELYDMVSKICEEKGWHLAFGIGDYLNDCFDLEKFAQKILYFPQLYRWKRKVDELSNCFDEMMDCEELNAEGDFLREPNSITDIDKQLDRIQKEIDTVYTPFRDRCSEAKDFEAKIEKFYFQKDNP